ncbi:glycosyltransferase family 2 protein [Alicyclobacillus fodiniaquatilis]|uniref:Glycosyltransferase family 2 protein n=1 Tax=Alicyclobacillus fodiniaquatilis TaxID=1661150 RepID=A0ABW4JDI8_9BACL
MKATVILPVYNQPERLRLTMLGLQQTDFAEPFEIVVVDDGSEPETARAIEDIQLPEHARCTLLYQENAGRAIARNRGIAHSRGEILIFCDADRVPSPQFVSEHVAAHGTSNQRVVIGNVQEMYISKLDKIRGYADLAPHMQRSKTPRYIKLMNDIYDSAGHTDSQVAWMTFYSGNASVHRAVLAQQQFEEGFVTWGVEHFELGLRLLQAGLEFTFAERAVNYHIAHARESSFYKDAYAKTLSHFASLHGETIASHFYAFMNGELSLQEMEHRIGSPQAEWLCRIEEPIVYKSISALR